MKDISIGITFEAMAMTNAPNYRTLENGHIEYEGILQSIDIINRNGKNYQLDALQEALNAPRIQELVARRLWMGELAHPYEKKDFYRCVEILPERVAIKILEIPKLRGNIFSSKIQTCAPLGGILEDWLKDQSIIGHSMRGITPYTFTKEQPYKHTVVKAPMTVLTYDAVLYPSHPEALMGTNAYSNYIAKESYSDYAPMTNSNQFIDLISQESGNYRLFKEELGIKIDPSSKMGFLFDKQKVIFGLEDGNNVIMDLELNLLKDIAHML